MVQISHLPIILEHMFQIAGMQFNPIIMENPLWRNKYVWSEEELSDFREWLFLYLKDSKEARQEFMQIPVKADKHVHRAVNTFLNNYGWKINYDIKRSENRRG